MSVLVVLFPPPPSLVGDKLDEPIVAGIFSSDFQYTDTKNTNNFTNQYGVRRTNDVFYKFTTTTTMDIIVSLCGSELNDTYLYLLNASGTQISYNDDSSMCGNYRSYVLRRSFPAGTYYVVCKGYSENGNITTQIIGTVPPPPAPAGDKLSNPLDAGTINVGSSYTNTQNTASGFTNQYNGRPTNDVFYKFTTTAPLDVNISLCGSVLDNTCLYLLDSSGGQLDYNDDSNQCGTSSARSCLSKPSLPAGTYYVVCEGYSLNGNITTQIIGTVPPPPLTPGDKQDNALDAGTINVGSYYTNTQNTAAGFTNQYVGRPTNDVYYKFTTTDALDVTLSLCGSALSDTYLYLLNASGNLVVSNDNSTQCSNNNQSNLESTTLPAGTYYVVCEGNAQNGSITLTIQASKAVPPAVNPVANATMNYIHTKTAREKVASSGSLTAENSIQTIQYFDGLGRPLQTVRAGASPMRQDLVSMTEYDGIGRESRQWLPVPVTNNYGNFVSPATLSGMAAGSSGYSDSRAFNEVKYEPSPLNRIAETYGPGNAWSTHPVKTGYLTNETTGNLSCIYYFVLANNDLKKGSVYPAGQLYVTQSTDEDNHVSYEFKDKQGRVVLQRQMSDDIPHDTYYVYDDYGNLCYVLPPMAVDEPNLSTAIENYGYAYRYDKRNRCVEKKLPGAGWIHMVYDRADRLILSQDGVQRTRNEWSVNIYDALGRLILSGIKNIASSRTALETQYGDTLVIESRSTYGNYGYTSPLVLAAVERLIVNYYDHFIHAIPYLLHTQSADDKCLPHESNKGLLVLREVKSSVGGNSSILSFHYDYKGNLLSNHNSQVGVATIDHIKYDYDFLGNVEKKQMKQAHQSGEVTLSEDYLYNYDHDGRMTEKKYSLNGGIFMSMAKYAFDDLGRMKAKNTGNLENTTYDYNLRGWLTSMSGNRFTESLRYTTTHEGNPGYFSGNIASLEWNTNNQGLQNYSFTYDPLSRMTSAAYGGSGSKDYSESLSYDKHGNPTSLTRYGRMDNLTSYGQIDALSMTSSFYDGNRLKRVTEAKPNLLSNDLMEFKYNYPSDEQYAYDANGNLTKDLNKKISKITYNHLNLPKRIDFETSEYIEYLYDASGVKLQTKHFGIKNYVGSTTTKNYVENKVYENGELKTILTEEGYVSKSGDSYTHHYYLKDHLGNNRVVMDQSGAVVQATSYYPFGLSFADYPQRNDQQVQPYKYNGKELDRMSGLDTYDFEARMYDPAIGRFMTMDPLAEKYYNISPYAYCLNNPIKYVDLDGRDPGEFFKTINAAAKDWGNYYNGASIIRGVEFGSTIYQVKVDGKTGYSYSVAAEGSEAGVKRSSSPNGEEREAIIHSHGEYLEGFNNNNFSNKDKKNSYDLKVDSYVATPDGSLKKYDPYTTNTTVVSTNLPSDSKDPDRKNKVNPTDVPMEKKRTQTTAEQDKKPEIKIPESEKNKIQWTF